MILILGRFQPFHNGHLKVVLDAMEKDKVVIALGSSQEKRTSSNPFSASERRRMILSALPIKPRIVLVPDIPFDERYVDHVIGMLRSKPDLVITQNKRTKELFSAKGVKVKTTRRYFGISGTKVRKMMVNDDDWKDLVPKQVRKIISDIKGVEKIRKICV